MTPNAPPVYVTNLPNIENTDSSLPVTSTADPTTSAAAVTPHASNAINPVPRALFVGTGGNITMRGVDGTSDQVWKNVPSGAILPFRAQYIRATGTTAADILALY